MKSKNIRAEMLVRAKAACEEVGRDLGHGEVFVIKNLGLGLDDEHCGYSACEQCVVGWGGAIDPGRRSKGSVDIPGLRIGRPKLPL